MRDGFLGFRTSLMLDVVVVALILLVPLVTLSILGVRRGLYKFHRNLQTALTITLLVTVAAFELDLHLIQGGWKSVVEKSRSNVTTAQMDKIRQSLDVHLVFAVSTPLVWLGTLVAAWKFMPRPPGPSAHSLWHRRLGWLCSLDLLMTSVTGLWFYYTAFIDH